MRLHHQVVESPAPRQFLSPAQALQLAREGPRGRRRRTITTPRLTEIVITDIVVTDEEAERGF